MPTTDLQPSDPRQLGPWRLTGRLGRGGMGVVYLGRADDGGQAAVKAIRADLDGQPALRERFRREVEAARRVARFCTAPVLGADLDGHVPWIASEYVNGPTLQDVVVERGPMSPSSLEGLAVGVAGALAAIHAAGVVHRDLKPANVLLSEVGPRVIDFGIAREAGDGAAGGQAGTPAFMAPEQHEGEEVGPAADVFAWAATMVFAGTGRLPFGPGPAASMAYRVVYGEPDLDGLHGRLLDVVKVCLAKDPAARPPAWTLLTWLTGDGTDPAEAAAAVLRRGWALPTPASRRAAGLGSSGGVPGKRRPRAGVLVAGALAGLLWLGGVAGGTAMVAARRPPPDPPPPNLAARLPTASTLAVASPPTTLLTPAVARRPPAARLDRSRPADLPGAELLLADDFSAKGNGWFETRPEETSDGESAMYADGGLRLVASTTMDDRPAQSTIELSAARVQVDAAFGGDSLATFWVDLGPVRVELRRDGRATVIAPPIGDDERTLLQAHSAALRANGFNRVAATIGPPSGKGKAATRHLRVTVGGERVADLDVPTDSALSLSVGVKRGGSGRHDPVAVLLDNFVLWGVRA